jgi:hypothetical protein
VALTSGTAATIASAVCIAYLRSHGLTWVAQSPAWLAVISGTIASAACIALPLSTVPSSHTWAWSVRRVDSIRSLLGLVLGSSVDRARRTETIVESEIAIKTILPIIFIKCWKNADTVPVVAVCHS